MSFSFNKKNNDQFVFSFHDEYVESIDDDNDDDFYDDDDDDDNIIDINIHDNNNEEERGNLIWNDARDTNDNGIFINKTTKRNPFRLLRKKTRRHGRRHRCCGSTTAFFREILRYIKHELANDSKVVIIGVILSFLLAVIFTSTSWSSWQQGGDGDTDSSSIIFPSESTFTNHTYTHETTMDSIPNNKNDILGDDDVNDDDDDDTNKATTISDKITDDDARFIPERPSPKLPPVFDITKLESISANKTNEGEGETFGELLKETKLKNEVNFKELVLDDLYKDHNYYNSESYFNNKTTAEGKAYDWILQDVGIFMEDTNTVNDISFMISIERIQQRYLLAVFYYHFSSDGHNDNWTNDDGWLQDQHECTWYGIRCGIVTEDEEDEGDDAKEQLLQEAVTVIHLPNNNLKGTSFPMELSYFIEMRYINLSQNYIEGRITSSNVFQDLTNLHTLYLNENYFTGSFPDNFTKNMDELKNLDLHDNSFSGGLPQILQYATNLVDIRIYNNEFNGILHEEWFEQLKELRVFIAGNNEFHGTIPSVIATVPENLVSLYLYENQFTGTIPNILSSELKHFMVDNNNLVGPVPPLSSYTEFSAIEIIRLEHNRLHGEIPYSYGDEHHNLKTLWLYDNQLTGTIPRELGKLSILESLKLERNSLTGSVPSEICKLRSGGKLDAFTAIISVCIDGTKKVQETYDEILYCDCCDDDTIGSC